MEVLEKAIADARTRRGWTAPKPVVVEVDGDDDSLYDQDPLGLAAALAVAMGVKIPLRMVLLPVSAT